MVELVLGERLVQKCPKCAYVRKSTDTAPDWQCPSCGIAYAKYGTVPHEHAHNFDQRIPPIRPGDTLLRPPASGGDSGTETEAPLGEFQPFAKLPGSDLFHLLATGMFTLGVVLAYMMWKSGERGLEIFILFPVGMVALPELGLLVVTLYKNLNRAEANGTLTENWRWVRRAMHAVAFVSIVLSTLYELGFL